ncbi:MAG: hypothetical protein ABIR70_11600 [Bryobacteraceae bacterium]
MRLATSLLLISQAAWGVSFTYEIAGRDAGAWPEALSSLGLSASEKADVIVVPSGTSGDFAARVEQGVILILEGDSPVATAFGFKATGKQTTIRSIVDARAPKLGIVWEQAATVARFEMPLAATVFAREKWENAPVLAGFRQGAGAVLWVATPLGPHGYSRYPYLPQALADLGLALPFHSARLWAFFDSSYRSRVDLDYLAPKWRAAGIAALHVAAWHYWETDPERDAYLKRLVEACHRNAIQVYAWVELPHVSERFWNNHPEWREKTAIGQDAQLDWRKLMNLTNRDAFAAVSKGLHDLVQRFDWDGVNLAELYFESLEGSDNPARFTPMNSDVRADFEAKAGFDPVEVFSPGSPRYWKTKPVSLGYFLNYRADLAHQQQADWIAQIEHIRKAKPWLDLTLTHVDDRLDTTMRDKIGADTAQTLPLLASHDFTFLVEDPATTWNLGPQRYPQLAARYAEATKKHEKLAIDINIVERYQDVYPTKQQTGLELFQLVHAASGAFSRVALYFENSIAQVDWSLLAAAASTVDRAETSDGKLTIESKRGVGVSWTGPATVDGRPWPVRSPDKLWLPGGSHTVQASVAEPAVLLTDLNADLRSATAIPDGMEFVYQSSARAFALLNREPARVEIDGEPSTGVVEGKLLKLPRGQHIVTVTLAPSTRSAR